MVSSDPTELLTAVHDLVKREADLVAELTLVRKELKTAKKALNDCNVAALIALKDEGSDPESGDDTPSESESKSEEHGKGDVDGHDVPVIAEQPALPLPHTDVVALGVQCPPYAALPHLPLLGLLP